MNVDPYLNGYIVFYDGQCPLCHWAVRYVIAQDHKQQFYFAALQGTFGKQFTNDRNLDYTQSLILWKPGEAFWVESQAVFQILKRLRGISRIWLIFSVLPTFITDWMYRGVAKNRYRFFKPYTDCPIPNPEQKNRFIES